MRIYDTINHYSVRLVPLYFVFSGDFENNHKHTLGLSTLKEESYFNVLLFQLFLSVESKQAQFSLN